MRKTAFMLAGALLVVGAQETAAQVAVNATASITIEELLEINVTNTTPTFGQPQFADFDVGHIDLDASGASVIGTRGNVEHRVMVSADAATMDFSGTPDPLKGAEDVQWDAGSGFVGLTTAGADVVTGLAAGEHVNAATVNYRMLLDETEDVPGTYTLDFTYTVTAN